MPQLQKALSFSNVWTNSFVLDVSRAIAAAGELHALGIGLVAVAGGALVVVGDAGLHDAVAVPQGGRVGVVGGAGQLGRQVGVAHVVGGAAWRDVHTFD